ncbi:hypothetical protein GGP80_003070 [Salinibacter ruber]|nr:hypothetical protein [Salinibacter ruber]
MRNVNSALEYFVEDFLPKVDAPFVLVTGSEDVTIPNQTDCRFQSFGASESSLIDRITGHPHLTKWFCENLDDASHPLMSPIPTGMVFKPPTSPKEIDVPESPSLEERSLRVLCAHRVREGPQWDTRRQVTELARSDWSEWCTVIEEEVPKAEFLELVRSHAFVLCVEGGGLDPSPKAWQAILNGAIPIIRETALKDACKELPVAFVPNWKAKSLSMRKLHEWHRHFSQLYQSPSYRKDVIRKLEIDYWWRKVSAHVDQAADRSISPNLFFEGLLQDVMSYLIATKRRAKSTASDVKRKLKYTFDI